MKPITYGLFNAQERGTLFLGPGEQVYQGMVVGENPKGGDIELNVCKRKQMTNTRASGSDEALKLVPHKVLSLEQALDFIENDELVEVTPKNIRIRKKILDPKQQYACRQKVILTRGLSFLNKDIKSGPIQHKPLSLPMLAAVHKAVKYTA